MAAQPSCHPQAPACDAEGIESAQDKGCGSNW